MEYKRLGDYIREVNVREQSYTCCDCMKFLGVNSDFDKTDDI